MSDSFSFFKMPTVQTPKSTGKKVAKGFGCESCSHKKNESMARYWGAGQSKILLVIETPSKTDLIAGKPFTGQAGAILSDILKSADLDPSQFWITYSSPCGANSSSTCRPNLDRIIEELDPTVIVPMGIGPVQALIASRITGRMKTQTKPTDFYGEQIPDVHYGRWICPTYSPYEMARIEAEKNKNGTRRTPWTAIDLRHFCASDLEYAYAKSNEGKPVPVDYESMVEVVQDRNRSIEILKSLQSYKGQFSFDFETTGLKPQKQGHYIDCVSMAVDIGKETKCYSMHYLKNDPEWIELWGNIMANPDIEKQAHNDPFESMWEKWRGAGKLPVGWYWDTQIAAHVLHNQKPTGLKFQTYVNLGIMGYDDEMDKYLAPTKDKSERYGANAINQIADAPVYPKLKYCGMDSLFTHFLQRIQEPKIRKPWNRKGFALFMEGFESFVDIMDNGMGFDENLANKQLSKIQAEITELENRISRLPGLIGRPGINLDSDDQVTKLLYEDLGFPPTRFGAKSDALSLEALKNHEPAREICELLLKRNKLSTARGYIKNYIRESVNGRIRGFLGLTGVATFRSSSDSPNMQNISKRDKQMKSLLRACFVPSPGNCIDECDLRGAEVFTSGCVHKDPNFLDYVRDYKTKDMHRDLAKQLYIRSNEEYLENPKLAKAERQNVKGPFTFACLYGMNGSDIADNMWHSFLPETEKHLKEIGLYDKQKWTAHVCKIYDDFWNNRFAVYGRWKQDTWKAFRERGYIDGNTGFRIHGPASYNQVTNAPIQGPAFHVSLFIINYVGKRIKKLTNGRSFVIGQIHDSVIFDIHPDDRPLRNQLYEEALSKIRTKWPWLIVPIVVEIEGTKPDRPWSELEELGMIVSNWEELK